MCFNLFGSVWILIEGKCEKVLIILAYLDVQTHNSLISLASLRRWRCQSTVFCTIGQLLKNSSNFGKRNESEAKLFQFPSPKNSEFSSFPFQFQFMLFGWKLKISQHNWGFFRFPQNTYYKTTINQILKFDCSDFSIILIAEKTGRLN